MLKAIIEWFKKVLWIRPQMAEDPRMDSYTDDLVNRFMRDDEREHFIYASAKKR